MPREKPEDAKVRVYCLCADKGWKELGLDCLYWNSTSDGSRMRLNFRSGKTLKIERKRPLTKEEKKLDPNKGAKWDALEEAPYTEVQDVDNGGIVLKGKKSDNASSQTKVKTTTIKKKED